MLVGVLAVLMRRHSVLFGLFVFSLFVMMDSFAVMMRRRFVMSGRRMVVFACGVFHGLRPSKEQTEWRRLQRDLQKT
jgi:hypothetical protein